MGDEGEKIADAASATVAVIKNALSGTDLQLALGEKKAYIRFDTHISQGDLLEIISASFFEKTAFAPNRIVLEIPQTVALDSHILERLNALKSDGVTIALSDCVDDPGAEPLLALADIVKLDASAVDQESLAQLTQKNAALGKQILALTVHTHEQFALSKSLGCSLFQGAFFAKPRKMVQADIPASTLRILDIMNNIMADADIAFLESAISHEVSLSYKLLKFVNSAGLSCGRELRTVKQALSMLGRNQLYRWLSLMLYASKDDEQDQSDALLNAALYRGRLLELFSEQSQMENPNELFVLGTFSYLDALLNRDMELIIKDISMPAPIKQALVEQDGRYWPFLNLAMAIDSGEIHQVQAGAQSLGLTLADINRAQLQALAYSEALS
jgi:EAL and modified HD-GYP domain-containing signal transduction protein